MAERDAEATIDRPGSPCGRDRLFHVVDSGIAIEAAARDV
jgi:hypothetical protein